jgi:hypothetical protein
MIVASCCEWLYRFGNMYQFAAGASFPKIHNPQMFLCEQSQSHVADKTAH